MFIDFPYFEKKEKKNVWLCVPTPKNFRMLETTS
jgi:hypothetical protein